MPRSGTRSPARSARIRCRATSRPLHAHLLGGSDLVIPATSKQKALAADWIKAFTDTASMTQIAQAGVIPNTTTLAKINAAKPTLAPFARAASYSWFVPAAKNWVNVESANVLQNMLVSIFTGRSTIKAAADRASNQITQILNEIVDSLRKSLQETRPSPPGPARPGGGVVAGPDPPRRRPVRASPPSDGGHRGRPRLPAVLAGATLVPEVRPRES